MKCIYSLVNCKSEAIGVSRFCEKHLKRQQNHAQRILRKKSSKKESVKVSEISDKANFETALKGVLDNLVNKIEEQRRESKPYKDLFEKSDNCESLLRDTEFKMTEIVLNACQVLKDKFDIKNVPEEIFRTLQMLPFLTHFMEKKISKEEGISCCVDKVYYLLSLEVLKRSKASP